jgi:hypothetical protein
MAGRIVTPTGPHSPPARIGAADAIRYTGGRTCTITNHQKAHPDRTLSGCKGSAI